MEKTIADFKDYDGVDASIETSLFEYGIIWAKGIEGHENDYHFIYGVKAREDECNGIEYFLFDWADIPIGCDLKSEYEWIEWEDVFSFVGMNEVDFFDREIPQIIYDLVAYYGADNIFGSSYYPFEIEKGG